MPNSPQRPRFGSALPICYDFVLFASMLGGGLTLLILSFASLSFAAAQLAVMRGLIGFIARRPAIPYGIALAAAAMLIYPYTVWMKPRALERRVRTRDFPFLLEAPIRGKAPRGRKN